MTISIVGIERHLRTAAHPDAKWGWRLADRLQDHLDGNFDPDNVFGIPYGSYNVGLMASVHRFSFCKHSEKTGEASIQIDLQPAYDVAAMVDDCVNSRIWPVRIVYRIFGILQQVLYGRGLTKAGRFVDVFLSRHLPELMDGLEVVRPHRKRYVSLFPSPGKERDALLEHLVAFQVFHEISHLIGARHKVVQNSMESPTDLDEELLCDNFACQEVISFGDQENVALFFRVTQISVFLLMLVWTLAAKHRHLQTEAGREAIFEELLRRAHAATLLIDRRYHSM